MTLLQDDATYIWHPYRQEKNNVPLLPIVRGKGTVLYAEDGREYLDLVSSWWVNTHGHAHPKIAQAIADQAQTLEQVLFSDGTHPTAAALAKQLVILLPDPITRVFYSDNGSTAVEVALKMAYQYWFNKDQPERRRFIGFQGAYHGDTFGAMSVGKSSGFYRPFESFLFHIDIMPYPETWDQDGDVMVKEAEALAHLDQHLKIYGTQTAALIIEPLIQGASGMRFCRPEFLQQVVEKVRAYGILVIFDEVMTGFGRTGALFACQRAQVDPDLICMAKGLTGGFLPLSVTAVREEIYEAFLGDTFEKAFAHGHSFAANPLGCAAALACLSLFEEEQTLMKIQDMETVHRHHIDKLANHPILGKKLSQGRVMGSIAAINMSIGEGYGSSFSRELKMKFFENGLFLRPLGSIIYLMPPYCTTQDQLDESYGKITKILLEMVGAVMSERHCALG